MLGLRRGCVYLADHDACWAEAARLAIGKIMSILGGIAIDAEHVGSTSVPGIKAKPIIDIAVGVDDFQAVLEMEESLKDEGFVHVPENDEDWQVFFYCGNDQGDIITHHIHVVKHNGKEWNGYLAFRDRLRSHREEALAYEDLKLGLMSRYGNDRDSYTAAKAEFILDILKKCMHNRPLDRVRPINGISHK